MDNFTSIEERTHKPEKVAVIIATAGRPPAVQDPMNAVFDMAQRLHSYEIEVAGFVSAPAESDIRGVLFPPGWSSIIGVRGASAQRNVALDALDDSIDFVFFFDDDAIPRGDYISNALEIFHIYRDIVGLTGSVIYDGAPVQHEISVEQANSILIQSIENLPFGEPGNIDIRHQELYGCNFAIRWSALNNLRFDSHLPLYSWLEDHDYACQAIRVGRLAKVEGCVAVHRGSDKSGRRAHKRFGYSQVANPVYIWQKGSFSLATASVQLLRPVVKNLALTIITFGANAERRQRLLGNALAVRDILKARGKANPEGIFDL